MNKKANIVDQPYILALILSITLTIICGGILMYYVNDSYSKISSAYVTPSMNATVKNMTTKSYTGFDNAFLIALLMFTVLSCVAAHKIKTSPVFWVVAIVYVFITWGFAIAISYAWVQLSTSAPIIITVLGNMPIVSYVMPRLLYYSIINTSIIAVVLYTKPD